VQSRQAPARRPPTSGRVPLVDAGRNWSSKIPWLGSRRAYPLSSRVGQAGFLFRGELLHPAPARDQSSWAGRYSPRNVYQMPASSSSSVPAERTRDREGDQLFLTSRNRGASSQSLVSLTAEEEALYNSCTASSYAQSIGPAVASLLWSCVLTAHSWRPCCAHVYARAHAVARTHPSCQVPERTLPTLRGLAPPAKVAPQVHVCKRERERG